MVKSMPNEQLQQKFNIAQPVGRWYKSDFKKKDFKIWNLMKWPANILRNTNQEAIVPHHVFGLYTYWW